MFKAFLKIPPGDQVVLKCPVSCKGLVLYLFSESEVPRFEDLYSCDFEPIKEDE